MARDIANPAPFTTGIALDHLDAGSDITELPDHIVLAADWHDDIYRKPPLIRYLAADDMHHNSPLLDFDLTVDAAQSSQQQIVFQVGNDEISTLFAFTLNPYPSIQYLDGEQPRLLVERGFRHIDLVEFLDGTPLRFYLADGSLVEGSQLFEAPEEDDLFDSENSMHVIDWDSLKVDITKEFGVATGPKTSIHDWLRTELLNGQDAIVFYDHRPGEAADFLTVRIAPDGTPEIALYHCKSAGGAPSGGRVEDLYEVCGQATKSAKWRTKRELIRQVQKRFQTGSQFVKGDLAALMQLVDPHPRYEFPLQVYIVQPGLSKAKLQPKLASILGATSRGLVAVGSKRLIVMCSG